jgi:hypothetical protein
MNSDQPPDPGSQVSDPWTITPQTSEDVDMIARLKRAGVLPHEVRRDPEHGIVLSHTGVRKLADCAPNQPAAAKLMEHVAVVMRRQIKVVQ